MGRPLTPAARRSAIGAFSALCIRRLLRRRPEATVPALSVSASGERARPAAACSGIRLRVSGRRGPPSPPGGGRGLEPRSLSRRRSPASAPGDARTSRRGLGPQFPDEASLWLVPSTPVARVFFWIGASEGRPGLTRLVVAASFSGIAGGSARACPGVRPPRLYLPDSGGPVSYTHLTLPTTPYV